MYHSRAVFFFLWCDWLHSSVGRALHQYCRGRGFQSRWSPEFFRLLYSNCLNWKFTALIISHFLTLHHLTIILLDKVEQNIVICQWQADQLLLLICETLTNHVILQKPSSITDLSFDHWICFAQLRLRNFKLYASLLKFYKFRQNHNFTFHNAKVH